MGFCFFVCFCFFLSLFLFVSLFRVFLKGEMPLSFCVNARIEHGNHQKCMESSDLKFVHVLVYTQCL